MIKLIASDIDGTLVKDGTLAIDREYMEVIERLIDKGIVFVACSGRQYRSERKLFAPVADRLLYISDGGTVVRTPKEILKVDTLPDEIWKGMCSMVRENMPSCDYFISTPERCFAEDGGSQMFHWLRDSYGYDIHEVPEMLKLEGQQVNKFAVYHPTPARKCAPLYSLPPGKTKQLWLPPARNGWTVLPRVPAKVLPSLSCRNIWEFHLTKPALSEITSTILKCFRMPGSATQSPTPARKYKLLPRIPAHPTGKTEFCRF